MARTKAAAIELNDVGVILVEEGRMSESDPGIAFFSGRQLLVGEQARKFWRTVPSQSNDGFWQHLSLDPLERPLGHTRSTADLAHAHLASIWESRVSQPGDVAIVVSSAFERERMGLLLGIAQSLSIPVVAVVDAALLGAMAAPDHVTCVVHVDIELHRCVITSVERSDGWARGSVEVIDDFGWLALMERWASAIADRFIRTTRFDPLHRAEDEQELHDRLPGCLETLRLSREVPLEIGPSGRRHGVSVPQQELAQATAPLLEGLLSNVRERLGSGAKTFCQVTAQLQACPGFESLARQELPCEVEVLARGFAAQRARERTQALRESDGSIPFVTRMRTEGASAPLLAGAPRGT